MDAEFSELIEASINKAPATIAAKQNPARMPMIPFGIVANYSRLGHELNGGSGSKTDPEVGLLHRAARAAAGLLIRGLQAGPESSYCHISEKVARIVTMVSKILWAADYFMELAIRGRIMSRAGRDFS